MDKTKSKSIVGIVLAVLMLACCLVLLSACDKDKTKTVEIKSYTEFVDALSGDADVIKLTENIDVESTLVVGRKVTIDLNGKTLSNSNDIFNNAEGIKNWSLISVRNGGDVVITGNGKLQAKENDCYALDVKDGGKLVVENGEFVGNVSAIYAFEGNVVVKGGKYYIQQLSNGHNDYRYTLNLYDENGQNGTATIEVIGGTFKNFNPENNLAEETDTNFVKSGYKAQLVSGSTTDYEVVKNA